jgi:S1/P1 Nuclease
MKTRSTAALLSNVSNGHFVRRSKSVLLNLFGLVLLSTPAWAWYTEGHQIVAVIAADELTPAARSQVAQILGVPDNTESVGKAMAAASIRPDTEFRRDNATPPWHYIAICLQDRQADLPARCPDGNCVTAKVDEFAKRLRDNDYDKWGAAGDLAFLIHFVGDILQPLHAATNADRNGVCQKVEVVPAEDNLHYAWDDAVVAVLEKQLGTHNPKATARRLEAFYPAVGDRARWKPGESEQIAWESHQLAVTDVYYALGIPERPCSPQSCDPATRTPVRMSPAYMDREAKVTGHQLAKAGHRLAALLNQIWPSQAAAP